MTWALTLALLSAAGEPTVPATEALAMRGYGPCALATWLPDAARPSPRRVTLGLTPVEAGPGQGAVAPERRFEEVLRARFVQRFAAAYGGEEALARRVQLEVVEAADYDAVLNAMRARQVQLSWMGATLYARAAGEVGVQPLLTAVRHGRPYYFGALVVHRDSGVRSVCELRGKSIAWVSPTSGAGYLFPRLGLADVQCDGQRIGDVDRFFGESLRAGEHLAVVTAVGQKTVDVGATWSDPPGSTTGSWTTMAKGQYADQLVPLWHTPPVPADGVVAASAFLQEEPRLAAQLACALSELHLDPDGLALMKELFSTQRLVPADQAQYDAIRSLWCRSVGGPGCEAQARSPRAVGAERPRFARPERVGVFAALLAVTLVTAALLRGERWRRLRRYAFASVGLGTFVWACLETQFTPAQLWAGFTRDATGGPGGAPNGLPDLLDQLWAMLHLDLEVAPQVLEGTVETLTTAVVATVVAGALSLPLGFLAASNVVGSAWVRGVIRFGLSADRAVDTLIVAVVLVAAFRLGPLPGTLALALHSVGNLAKLFYEAVETLDRGPAEAMEAVGARRLEVVRWGLWPQAVPHFISHFLYRFEMNVRVAVVLGLVGGGGIGTLLMDYRGRGDWGQVAMVVLTVMVLVMALDAASARLRKAVG